MKIIEEPKLNVKSKLPWIIDIFFYPISASGIIHIVIFLIIPRVIRFIDRFILDWVWPVGQLITLLLYLLFAGYVFFYLGYCIFDSSKGGYRAPDISTEPIPDKSELVSQLFLILGSTAICFCLAAVYYIFTRQTDLIFWILGACGAFFFPMALLSGVLFDSFDALNPISIIRSICKVLLPYCGLIFSLCAFGGLVAIISLALRRLQVLSFISDGIYFYLLLIGAHLLGRFYWWHKDKLDWGL